MVHMIEQGSYTSSADRISDKELASQTFFLSSAAECCVRLAADVKNFKITKAEYAIHRLNNRDDLRREGAIPDLVGASAYFDGGKAVRALDDFGDDGFIKELLRESIRSICQAETYLISERGFTDRREYEVNWLKDKDDYCRPYRKECMPGLDEWTKHIGADRYARKRNLYNKYKSYSIFKNEGSDEVSAQGTYNDSFHEMSCSFGYREAERKIIAFDMSVCRAPYKPCFELTHASADLFVGKTIDELTKREVGKLIGGALGCFHLVDIVADMTAAASRL